ncbi:hypothetical protein RFI_00087 [Reticulomyxa filosa]|uniref:Uncharacterized protein n=1 Tax=Reticulomyxa filosa TaxID=46433 RepID=X6PER3_RETFI|nr:hypothetical protein RFI_00087 [Reticulomyxa filosa]|eukprot:ETO36975.1 hypothetical protein RFI_00087 [Reticulomyxa filosa]
MRFYVKYSIIVYLHSVWCLYLFSWLDKHTRFFCKNYHLHFNKKGFRIFMGSTVTRSLKTAWNYVAEPLLEVTTHPVKKALIWTGERIGVRKVEGTERHLRAKKANMDDRIIQFRVYKSFIRNDFFAGLASIVTKPLTNIAVMHWWAELKTESGHYYFTQFNHPFQEDYNEIILVYVYNKKINKNMYTFAYVHEFK